MSGIVTRSRLSLEYIGLVKVTWNVDPTSDTVQIALTQPGVDPVATDWVVAAWAGPAVLVGGQYTAYARRAPATVATTSDVWIKITDSPEIPATKAGTYAIT